MVGTVVLVVGLGIPRSLGRSFGLSRAGSTRSDEPMVHFALALRHRWHGVLVEVIKSRLQRSLWPRHRSQA